MQSWRVKRLHSIEKKKVPKESLNQASSNLLNLFVSFLQKNSAKFLSKSRSMNSVGNNLFIKQS